MFGGSVRVCVLVCSEGGGEGGGRICALFCFWDLVFCCA